MKQIKIKPDSIVTAALVVLGVAQMLLTNTKDAAEKAKLKEEILEELTKNQTT